MVNILHGLYVWGHWPVWYVFFAKCLVSDAYLPFIHSVCPPKFCISIKFVFKFFWDIQSSQEKFKMMLMQNFGGQTKCIMGNVEMENTCNKIVLFLF